VYDCWEIGYWAGGIASSLHYFTTVLLHCCTAALLHYRTAALLYCCTAALLHCYTAALLYCCTAALLFYDSTTLHRHATYTARDNTFCRHRRMDTYLRDSVHVRDFLSSQSTLSCFRRADGGVRSIQGGAKILPTPPTPLHPTRSLFQSYFTSCCLNQPCPAPSIPFHPTQVETIGDAYMVASGHDGSDDHALKVIRRVN
jgi:hypothetical protein